ncbi:MAG: gluconate 2-dehydrogenase subunit 3 family protein [Rhodothalassiaceae bacterium]
MPTRRGLLGGIGLLGFTIAGRSLVLSPAEARAAGYRPQTLSSAEAATLEAVGEALVPGAAEAGIAAYVDQQISGPPEEALLMLRYLDVPPPYAGFYRAALARVDDIARESFGSSMADIGPEAATGLVRDLVERDFSAYFALRADAVDVVYGTRAGMERLGVPIMGHIEPESEW